MNVREWSRAPDGPMWDRWRQWTRRWGRVIPFIGVAMIVAGPAMAQGTDTGLSDTTRVLEHLSNECMGVQNCRTIESVRHQVTVGQSVSIVVQCPSTQPHLVGWDTEQHEHLSVYLAPTGVQTASGQPMPAAHKGGDRLTLFVTNNADAPGFIQVFLGCADQASQTTAGRQYRGGNPSNVTSPTQRGQR